MCIYKSFKIYSRNDTCFMLSRFLAAVKPRYTAMQRNLTPFAKTLSMKLVVVCGKIEVVSSISIISE